MDHADWINATGHAYAGRGARPINPKMLPRLVAKAAPPAKSKASRQLRRLQLQLAESSLRQSRILAKPNKRDTTSLPAMWQQRVRQLAVTRTRAGRR